MNARFRRVKSAHLQQFNAELNFIFSLNSSNCEDKAAFDKWRLNGFFLKEKGLSYPTEALAVLPLNTFRHGGATVGSTCAFANGS